MITTQEMIESLGRGLEKIETHISWVLLDEKHAYKIKKPVKFWFLDYSTPERRKFFCEEEVRFNRQLSPDIYIGVVPITKDQQDRYAFSGKGKVVEYAVKMVRLPEEASVQRMLSSGKLGSGQINALINKVVGFHKDARTISESEHDYAGTVRCLHEHDAEMVIDVMKDSKDDLVRVERLMGQMERFIEKNYELFRKRQLSGKVRECHGDMHSRNIYFTDRPVFIDRIEFNKEFRYQDVLCEVSFLAMDFERWGDCGMASTIWDEYFRASGEERIDELINFHSCRMALVRAMITVLRNRNGLKTEQDGDVSSYIGLAERFAELI